MATNFPSGWLSYIDRTYEQIKAAIVSKIPLRIPEMTDLSEGNPLVKATGIWAGIAEMLGYYIDNNAQETYIVTSELYESAVNHAKGADYRVRLAHAAYCTVVFMTKEKTLENTYFPTGLVVCNDDETIRFQTVEDAVINEDLTESNPVQAVQRIRLTNIAVTSGTGLPNQFLTLISSKIVDNSITVTVAGDVWTPKDTFAYSNTESKDFVAGADTDGTVNIRFGDGVLGFCPPLGAEIVVDADVCEGLAGNILVGTITKMLGVLPSPPQTPVEISAKNTVGGTTGSNYETLDDLQRNVPIFHRTRRRAVTLADFRELVETHPAVLKAGEYYDNTMGFRIDLFIVPKGGGVATTQVLAEVLAYITSMAVYRAIPFVASAGEVMTKITVTLGVVQGYSRQVAANNVKTNLLAFFAPEKQKLRGTLRLSDIYETIENTTGIEWSNVASVVITPFAHPIDHLTQLNWEVVLGTASAYTLKWDIIMVTSSGFQLFKEGDFVGNFQVNNLLQLPEVHFKVLGTYTPGKHWTFWTYPSISSENKIVLEEMSLLAVSADDILLTTVGGI